MGVEGDPRTRGAVNINGEKEAVVYGGWAAQLPSIPSEKPSDGALSAARPSSHPGHLADSHNCPRLNQGATGEMNTCGKFDVTRTHI
ncbi:unnamed protein product [Lampetra planeri]